MVVMTMDSEQMKAHELHEAIEANDRGVTLMGRDDYELLLTLLSDELGADTDNESMHAMLLALQARLVEARRWRTGLEAIKVLGKADNGFDMAQAIARQVLLDQTLTADDIESGQQLARELGLLDDDGNVIEGKLPSAAAIAWGERKLTELGLLDSALGTTDDTEGGA